jgi:hypothetical protein
VRAFETCEIHPAEFKHYQHLAVALWYVSHLPYSEACEKLKRGIQRLAASYGKTGYHETITEFWLRKVREFLRSMESQGSLSALTNQLIERYANKNLIFDYYSKEALDSKEARTGWVEPNLKPFHS